MARILEGIRVFDLTVAAVGPWSTKLLGAMGADVIRVERPGGDNLSTAVPPRINGTSVLHISANQNKRNIELDLKKESDRALALKIIERSDVFVQNMRTGTVERLGLGYEAVAKVNPRIIYVAASAYGRTGPMAHYGAIDPEIQAMCGWCSITGQEGGRGEMFRHLGHIDLTTATYITQAVLQALLARERTGKGQKIEIEMLRAAMAIQTTRLAEYFAAGAQPQPMGSANATEVPHQAFICQDQKYIAVGVVKEEQWPALCRALKVTEMASDPRFHTNAARLEHRARADSNSRRAVQDQTRRVVDNCAYAREGAQRTVSQLRRTALPSAGPQQRIHGRNRFAGLGQDLVGWTAVEIRYHSGGSDPAQRNARIAYC